MRQLCLFAALAAASSPGLDAQSGPARSPEFLQNHGQWPAAVRHFVRHRGLLTWLTDTGWTTRMERFVEPPDPGRPGIHEPEPPVRGVVLTTTLVGSQGPRAVAASRPGRARYHYFLGDDPTRWVSDLRGHGELRYHDMLPGIDLVYRLDDGALHYDVHVAPGVAAASVRFAIAGHDELRLAHDGALLVETDCGALRHSAPVAFELLPDGGQRALGSRFVLHGDEQVGFAVDGRDPARPLVIDPGLTWARFHGGTGNDFARLCDSVDVADNGDVMLSGTSYSGFNFPTTTGTYQMFGVNGDCFVSRFDAAGGLLWSAYFGGNQLDQANGVEALPTGEVAVVGSTASTNWPWTAGAPQTTYGGGNQDGFALVLSNAGATLQWSTYVGGSGNDLLFPVEFHPSGLLVTCGWTNSSNFPIAGTPVQPAQTPATCTNNADCTVAVFDLTGNLVVSTYYGGGCDDYFQYLDLDGDEIVVGGATDSTNFPVTATTAYQPVHAGTSNPLLLGPRDGCIVRFDLGLTTVNYATFFGGLWREDARIAATTNGRVAVTGWTRSTLPTTPGAPQPTRGGGTDAYVGVLDTTLPPAQQLTFLTYLGGLDDEGVNGVAMTPDGFVTVVGSVQSADFPTTTGAFDTTFNGPLWDAWLARLDTEPGAAVPLVYSTFLGGGDSFDYAYAVDLTPEGDAVVSINAGASTFPITLGPGFAGGNNDAALARLDVLPTGVFRYGAPSPACHGPAHLSVNSAPVPGNAQFELLASGVPAASLGLIAFGPAAAAPTTVLGVDVWVGVPPALALPTLSDANGFARFPLPLPASPAWSFGGFQTVWLPAAGCAPYVATDALQ